MIMQAWKPWALLALAGLLLAASDRRALGVPPRAFPESLERLARDYRIRIYNTFRQNREEYDRRRQALESLQQSWAGAEQTTAEQQAIAAWLREGIRHSTPGSIRPLAPLPTFDRTAHEPPRDDSPEAATRAPLPAERTVAPPRASDEAPRTFDPPHTSALPPELSARALPDLDAAPSLETEAVPRVEMRRRLPNELTIVPPALPRRSAAPAEIEVPMQSLARLTTSGIHDARPAPQAPIEKARINLVELQARISGFNRSIRALEIRWSERTAWTAAELTAELASLEETLALRPNLDLYVNLLGESERETTGAPVAIEETVHLFERKLAAVRADVASAKFAGTQEDRRRELEILQALSRRLAERARGAQTRGD